MLLPSTTRTVVRDPATAAVELLAAELASTRVLLAELFASQRSETVVLREEVARLREDVMRHPVHPLVVSTRAILQAHNEALADRADRLGGAAADAFVQAGEEVGLDRDGMLAVEAWVRTGGRGVVVDPDAERRLLVGLTAVTHLARSGHPVLVVAPRRQDVIRWTEDLRRLLPGVPVLTGPASTSERGVRVLTARAAAQGAVPAAVLLVAVDAERFGAPSLAAALDERCPWRLGLSGAYRRADDGLVRLTDPFFDTGVVHVA